MQAGGRVVPAASVDLVAVADRVVLERGRPQSQPKQPGSGDQPISPDGILN